MLMIGIDHQKEKHEEEVVRFNREDEQMMKYGYIGSQSIRESIKPILSSMIESVVVLRCVDSSHLLKDIRDILEFHEFPYKLINGNVCLFEDQWEMINTDVLFSGFDEVWIFKKKRSCNQS
jgi:hypothetical protein